MSKRTCIVDGCEHPHWARGLCSKHYSYRHRERHGRKKHPRVCVCCGETWLTESPVSRYCSPLCSTYDRYGAQTCAWKPPRAPATKPVPFCEERSCAWCGDQFAATRSSQIYCSADHKAKAKRLRRRGREFGWTSNYTWSEVMKVWRKFDRRCAYCEGAIDGLPDPDHVVPLSRGGCNSITNILPCCSLCNSDKRDLLLSEWNADRERRGLPPRVVVWDAADSRVWHLTSLLADVG